MVSDSVGASRHSKGRRSGWDQVRELLGSGGVDVLVTWEASRAQRDLAVYADLRDLCVEHGVLWAYSGRVHDLASADGRFRTGLDALLAEREADETAERVRRAVRANAAAGRPHGRRLFGYVRVYDPDTGGLVGQEPHPTEATVVARIFAMYLSGRGIRTIAKVLNDEGITTGTGSTWVDGQVRRVLRNPAYAARRVHQGKVIGEAEWPALVTADMFDRVQARQDERRGQKHPSTARLLTGVGRCGVCGAKLNVGRDRRRRSVYQCREGFHVARDLAMLDGYVSVVLLDRLSRPDVTETLAGAPDPAVESARERVVELRARLDSAVDEFTRGDLTASTLAAVERRLHAEIAAAERDVRRAVVPLDVDIPAVDVDAWWEDLEPEVRRAVAGAMFAAVTVHPVGKGRRTFDPSAVAIEWRR